ncbi:MAG: sulfatase [Planctomycetaceae bacterium]|jgi:arylsulfatase A-like enzyme|nr:sulfatase [Planctomycetaceae bacterium]
MNLFRKIVLIIVTCLVAEQLYAVDSVKPNVLFIAIDDLNDWVGFLDGHPQAQTPNMDRLAKRGVVFANAHCQAPICNPSRVSLLTGTLPSTTGIYLLGPTDFRKACPLLKNAEETPTLPEHFAANGYRTIGGGKIYHGATSRETFQEYGPRGGNGAFPKRKLSYPTGVKLWDWGRFPENDDQQGDHGVATWAVEQLAEPQTKPFFLAIGFFRPHVPLYASEKWWNIIGPADDILLPQTLSSDNDDIVAFARKLTWSGLAPRHNWMVEHDQWKPAVHAYLACVSFVDHQVGRVLDALDASTHAENTIIVLWSDHGWALGEKQRWAKRGLWEAETRVPLIVAAPGIKGERRCEQPAGLIDIYPTLADLCGLEKPPHLEGRSLVRQLEDVNAERPPVITTFFENNHSVRSTRWRYIRYSTGDEELYDHNADPHEWHNLASNPKLKTLVEKLAKHLPAVNAETAPGSSGLGSREEDRHLFRNVK